MALPRNCKGCLRVDRITKRCYAFKTPYLIDCPSKCENPSQIIKENMQIIQRNLNTNIIIVAECERIIKDMKKLIYQGLQAAYVEDMNRGSGGGGSKNNKNSGAAIKQKMKDNRPIDCKPTRGELNQYSEELKEWQEENEKLDVHKSIGYGMSRSKVDSYTGLNLGELSDDDIIEAAEKLLNQGLINQESYDDIIYGRIEI